MSDSQWNVYRKNKWNTYLQKKKEPYREIEAWYLKTRDEHIDNLVKFSQIQKTTISEFETNTKKQFTDPISS
jgi:hypothetical protein